MIVEWSDKLETGIPEIDEQHKELIVTLNRLGRLKYGKEDFLEVLEELIEYTNIHFKTEENYMIKDNYPGYDKHKSYHNLLINKLSDYIKEFYETEDIEDLGTRLYDFVGNWMVNHYSGEDINLASFIKKHY